MGDGGFWHNGLTSGIGNAVFNRDDNVTIIVDNGYSAATGGQDMLSSRAREREPQHQACDRDGGARRRRQVGARGRPHLRRRQMRDVLTEALTTKDKGPKVIIAQSECMLNKQRRVKPLFGKAVKDGERVVRERFGVDADTCTGDHACIRLSGCPSLTIKPNPDPLQDRSRRASRQSCVGCGLCGEVSARRGAVPVVLQGRDRLQPDCGVDRVAAIAGCVIGRVTRTSPSRMVDERQRITIAILALGGQGGGVLCRLADRGRGEERLRRAGDLGAGRGAAHRRDGLLPRAVSGRRAARPAIRCWR